MKPEVIVAIIVGGGTLLGALVGGFLSCWATSSLENLRWKREDKFRFHKDRNSAYLQLLTALNKIAMYVHQNDKRAIDEVVEFFNAFARIQIYGSQSVLEEAERFRKVASKVVSTKIDAKEFDELLKKEKYPEHRKALLQAIRDELGIDKLGMV